MDIFPAMQTPLFDFFGDEIEEIEAFDPISNQSIEKYERLNIYPANMFVTSPDILQNAIHQIQDDLVKQIDFLEKWGNRWKQNVSKNAPILILK